MAGVEPVRAARWYALLRSQGLGLVCGFAVVALLAIGSVVLAATRDGAAADIALDDIRPFFTRPSVWHSWFYLLLLVCAIYALNLTLCTWHSLVDRWRSGLRQPAAYGTVLIHVSVLVALLAHLVGGLFGAELGVVTVSSEWSALADGRSVQLRSLQTEQTASGALAQVRAQLTVRSADGAQRDAVVGYNAPLSSGLGSTLHLLLDQGQLPGAALLTVAGRPCRAEVAGAACTVGRWSVALTDVLAAGQFGPRPVARIRAWRADLAPRAHWLVPGRASALDDATQISVEGFEDRPAIALRGRRAPGNPLALISALLLASGLLLSWRRFARRLD